ncbi:MAG: methyltransferase domain-containing protein [Bacteroidota bacterium]
MAAEARLASFRLDLTHADTYTPVLPMSDGQDTPRPVSPAEVYESFFLPALFQAWAPRAADAAHLQPGHRVLDVACGTGVFAREALQRVGPQGTVVGLDPEPGMLRVARQKAPQVKWVEGLAEALPFEDEHFEAVVSQFGLMFFGDQPGALREMQRVLRPGGRLVVTVWDALERTPGYAALAAFVERVFDPAVAASLQAPYALGDPQTLLALFAEAGVTGAQLATHHGTARFPSVRAWLYTWVHSNAKGKTAAHLIDDDGFERLVAEAERALRPFVSATGTVSFSTPAHLVTAVKR